MACSRTLQATFIFLAAAAAISLQSENSENSFPAAEAAAAAGITDFDRQLGQNAVVTYNNDGRGSGIPLTFCNVIGKSTRGDFLTLDMLVQVAKEPTNQPWHAAAVYDVQNRKHSSYIQLKLGNIYNGVPPATCNTAS